MYLSEGRMADAAAGVPGRVLGGVSANVLALGAVSFFTDVSAEMVTAVLPLYLVGVLHLNPLQFGALDGLYTGVTALVRLAGGHLADRWNRRKAVALSGYALSAAMKLALPLAGRDVMAIGAVLAADRTGKGLRTAPRDALISLSGPPETLGRAFGVHRALDTLGALLGPLLAFAVLAAVSGTAAVTSGALTAVYVVSCCVALLGVLVMAGFVRDDRRPLPDRKAVSLRAAFRLLRPGGYRRLCLAVFPLAVATISDAFLCLLIQHRLDLPGGWLPLLPAGMFLSYFLFSVPLGRLTDRVGGRAVILSGYAALLGCYLLLLLAAGPLVLVGVLALRGLAYAATDGVLMAVAGPLIPAELRTSGLALLQTGTALAAPVSALGFGAAWTYAGPGPAVAGMTCLLALALAVAGWLLPGSAVKGERGEGGAR